MTLAAPDIYLHFDFRQYLEAWRDWRKLSGNPVTLEALGEALGLRSRGQVSLILNGRRNLAIKQIPELANFLGLESQKRKYFEALLLFTQAKSHLEKKAHLDHMVQILGGEGLVLNSGQVALCEKWYYPVVREIIRIKKIREDGFASLACLVRPSISEREAEKALSVLQQIGLIFLNHKGYWQQTEARLRFPDGVASTVLRQFQMDSLLRASKALETIPPAEREIGSLTVSVSEDRYRLICERLQGFRKELVGLVCSDDEPEVVAQINLTCIPVSAIKTSVNKRIP